MTDWATISSLATGVGTLILALATFSSVRAANRSAAVGERALLGANRPLLVPSHIYDPEEDVRFADDRWVKIKGGHAYAAASDEAIYFVISLRNAGPGMAVLDRWRFSNEDVAHDDGPGDTSKYRRLTRDLYVAAGEAGFWQGAIRDKADPQFNEAVAAISAKKAIHIDIQYADQEGGQRTVSHFALTPGKDDEWPVSAARHWRLDGPNPRILV
jgi:hypothetical protein